ncbi:hypothetical protein [Pseudomonas sp. Marseille-QA0332]
MNIACLGWGSLLWKPGALRIAGQWKADGPPVAVEFCRVAEGGELSTAISLNAQPLPVFWAQVDSDDLESACRMLREREQIPAQRSDGVASMLIAPGQEGPLMRWAIARRLDAVIWTGLPPCFAGIENRMPSQRDAIDYLQGLEGDQLKHARDYIEQVPRQLDTSYRQAIRRELGWG